MFRQLVFPNLFAIVKFFGKEIGCLLDESPPFFLEAILMSKLSPVVGQERVILYMYVNSIYQTLESPPISLYSSSTPDQNIGS